MIAKCPAPWRRDLGQDSPIKEARKHTGLSLTIHISLLLYTQVYAEVCDSHDKTFESISENREVLSDYSPTFCLLHQFQQILVVKGIPNEKIPIYMNAANLLVLASYREGSPNAIKEAMACNLPVVSTDVGDVREIIDGVEGCALFRPEADDLARTLSLVLAGPAHTEGRAAIEHLRIERIADRVLDLYREVLSGKRTGGR